MANIEIKDGEYTKTIYSMIKEQRYSEAVNILSFIYDSNPSSRAALSLLAYCYYYTQDFVNAANCYEQLTLLYPDNEDYKIYYAQALYQACLYEEAMKVTVQIENPELQGKMLKLQAAIKYGDEDLPGKEFCTTFCFAFTLGFLAFSITVRSAIIHLQPKFYNFTFKQDWKSKQNKKQYKA